MTKKLLLYASLIVLCCLVGAYAVNNATSKKGNLTPRTTIQAPQDASVKVPVLSPASKLALSPKAAAKAAHDAAAVKAKEEALRNSKAANGEPVTIEKPFNPQDGQNLMPVTPYSEPVAGTYNTAVAPVAVEEKVDKTVEVRMPDVYEMPTPTVASFEAAPVVSNEDILAEIESLTAQIADLKAAGQVPASYLYSQLDYLGSQLPYEPVRESNSNLDDFAGETCALAYVIDPAALPFCDSGTLGLTDDCANTTTNAYNDKFYSFTPSVTDTYRISMIGSGTSALTLDGILRVWSGGCCTGTVVGTSDDEGGGLDPAKDFVLTAGVTYTLEIGKYSTNVTPPPTYRFQLLGPIDMVAAPANDLIAGAITLTPGAAAATYSSRTATNDAVVSCGTTTANRGIWFKVIGNGNFLTATTDYPCTSGDTYVRVYRGVGGTTTLVCVGYNDNTTANSSSSVSTFAWCSDQDSTYYVCVSEASTSAGRMQFEYNFGILNGTPCACPTIAMCGTTGETEPNQTCASAAAFTAIGCNATVYGLHCAEADTDFFKITVPAGSRMTIKLWDGAGCATNPPTTVKSALYSNACAAGTYSTTDKAVTRTAFATDTTLYFAVIDLNNPGTSRTGYKITTICESCATLTPCGTSSEVEPNQTCAQAAAFTAYTCGQDIFGLHCIESDSDFYKITVPAGAKMTIRAYDGAGCTVNPPTKVAFGIYTNACVSSISASTADKVINRTAAATDTTLYIYVKDVGASTAISAYKISLTCQTCTYANLDNETLNNACDPAVPVVACGDTVCGTIGVTGDNDFYQFTIPTGICDSVFINVFGDDTPPFFPYGLGLDPRVVLYGSACDSLNYGEDASGAGGSLGFDAYLSAGRLTAGTYYLRVRGYSNTSVGPYVMAIRCVPTSCEVACPVTCPPVNTTEVESNNSCDVATPAAVGYLCGDVTTSVSTRDIDWFSFTLTEPDSVVLRVTPSNFTAVAQIIGGTCLAPVVLGSATGTAHCSTTVATSPCLAPGTYWVLVAPTFEAITGPFGYVAQIQTFACTLPQGRCCYGDPTALSCVDTVAYRCTQLNGTWSASLTCLANPCPTCIVDYAVNYSEASGTVTINGNTTGAGDNCSLRTGEDQVVQISVDHNCEVRMSLCGTTPEWDTYIYLTTACCGGTTIAYNDDYCGSLSEIQSVFLAAGTYYLDIEPYGTASGAWTLDITEIFPCPPVTCTPTYTEVEPNGGCKTTPVESLNTITNGEIVHGSVTATLTTRDYDGYRYITTGTSGCNGNAVLSVSVLSEFNATIDLYSDSTGGVCSDSYITSMNAAPRCSTETISNYQVPSGEVHIYVYPPLEVMVDNMEYCMVVSEVQWMPMMGDDCDTPVDITSLPFTDSRSTCGACDNIDTSCISSANYDNGPDIFYKVRFLTDTTIKVILHPRSNISETGSPYGSVLISTACFPTTGSCVVGGEAFGASDTTLTIPCLFLTAGTYYIMVDNWAPGPDCINYGLEVLGCVPCLPVCPPEGIAEGEVCDPLVDDVFNGGCDVTTSTLYTSPIALDEVACGTAWSTDTTRDVDWYHLNLTSETIVSAKVVAKIPVRMQIIEGNCATNEFYYVSTLDALDSAAACDTLTEVTIFLHEGDYYLIVYPKDFAEHPCGNYILSVTGVTCVLPTGRCCYGTDPFAPLCAVNRAFECDVLTGSWTEGLTCATVCPIPPQCDASAVVSQRPVLPDESWTFAYSDTIYQCYENFTNVTAPITSMRFWAISATGAGVACAEPTRPLTISFFADSAGAPVLTAPVYTTTVVITPTELTDWTYILAGVNPVNLLQYDFVLPTPVALPIGWVSIKGADNADGCWFMWAASLLGQDAMSMQYDGTSMTTSSYDLSLCLGTVPNSCAPATNLSVYKKAADPLHMWLHFDVTELGNYDVYMTIIKNATNNPLGNPDYTMIGTVNAIALGQQVFTDTSAIAAYKNFVVVHNCTPEILPVPQGRCCYGANFGECAVNSQAACATLNGHWEHLTTCATACPIPTYCTVVHTTCDEYVGEFVLGTIDNVTACTAGGYNDYTAISTNLTIGVGTPVTVNNPVPYTADATTVWVDWNNDYDFTDAGEQIDLTSVGGTGSTFTGIITPPAGSAGTHRLRVRIGWSWTPTPCGTTNYGEAEDYTIVVTP